MKRNNLCHIHHHEENAPVLIDHVFTGDGLAISLYTWLKARNLPIGLAPGLDQKKPWQIPFTAMCTVPSLALITNLCPVCAC